MQVFTYEDVDSLPNTHTVAALWASRAHVFARFMHAGVHGLQVRWRAPPTNYTQVMHRASNEECCDFQELAGWERI